MSTMPLSITALYAGILALMMVALAIRVVVNRARSKINIFDGGDPALGRAIRLHGNFIEYVPHALILMALIELNGTAAWAMHTLGIALVVGRLLHLNALKGLEGLEGATFAFRVIGVTLNWLVIAIAGIWAIYQYTMAGGTPMAS